MSAAPAPEQNEGQVIPFVQQWGNVPVTEAHAEYLQGKAAISSSVAKSVGIYSVTNASQLPDEFSHLGRHVPGLVFPWTSPHGGVALQYRPDCGISGPDVRPRTDDGKPVKYIHEKGSGGVIGAVRVVHRAKRALLVEGTKQALAAASYAPLDTSVYAIAGCRNWSNGGAPSADLDVFDGLETFIVFDADLKTNLDVWTAAQNLELALKAEGAEKIRWVAVPAGAKAGLDDVLSVRKESRRALYLERLMDDAMARLPRAPRKAASAAGGSGSSGGDAVAPHDDSARFFDDKYGLMVADLSDAVRDKFPAVLTQEHKIALYQDGVYRMNGKGFSGAVAGLLHNRFRPAHRSAAEEYTEGVLLNENKFIPETTNVPLLNLSNGMLDLDTLELLPHDPSYFSGQQLPIEWSEDAPCPTYDRWVGLVGILDQLEDLEEVTSLMLDPTGTPPKAIFAFGPSKSGKSTWLRLMQYIAGSDNYSAVTLHQLVSNRFVAAQVYGKILNCAADLSSAHVQDLSIFKMMTGDDPINGEFKGTNHFVFRNRALFAFAANELPTVGESSDAYVNRVKPFRFSKSFAGREDPSLEASMRGELPGILSRWVKARLRKKGRGSFLETMPDVRREFEVRSDRVRQFVEERCDVHPAHSGETLPNAKVTTKAKITEAFNQWALDQARSKMGRDQIVSRLMSVPGVVEVRATPSKTRGLNLTVRREGDDRESILLTDPPVATGGSSGGSEWQLVAEIGSLSATASSQVNGTMTPSSGNSGSSNQPFIGTEETPTGVCDAAVEESASETATSATQSQKGPLTCDDAVAKCSAETATELPPAATDCGEVATAATEPVVLLTFEAGSVLPEGVIALDIETGSAEKIWDQDPRFIRLLGYQVGDTITVTNDPSALLSLLPTAKLVVGHNVMSFDLVAYALRYGVDIRALADEGRIFDTMLASIIADPPRAEGLEEKRAIGTIMRERRLDALGTAILGVAKSGDLDAMVKEFGGYDKIPVDDVRYTEYLRGDVDLTARLAKEMTMSSERRAYLNREHRVAAVAAQIRTNGFRVDVALAQERYQAGVDRGKQLVEELTSRYPLPVEKADGKPVKSPQSTKEGRAVLVQAFEDLGVVLKLTPKGSPALGKDFLADIAEEHPDNPEVLWLTERVSALNGIRSVYKTALDNLHGDRVHPDITMFQASGRWSFTHPGMTVFGKNNGKYTERGIFLPEPGHVIIAADLAQVDARALAALSQDEGYLAMFAPGLDLHSEVARRAFGKPPAELIDEHDIKAWLKARRTEAKIVGHGWNYGRSVNALAKDVGIEVATEFDQQMTAEFPRLVEWRQEVRRAGERGELLDNGFGRMMAVKPDRAWTQAPALMGQGCARDLMMEGLLRMPKYLLPYLRAVVHDEVVLSIPEDRADEIEQDVVNALSFDWAPSWGEHTVRIEAGLSIGNGIDGTGRGRDWGHVYEEFV